MTIATAFSIDLRVMMSRGRMFFRIAATRTFAESPAESAFSGSGEAICEDPRRLMPSASNEEDMVFAVYCPPQAPTEGQAFFSMPWKSSCPSVGACGGQYTDRKSTRLNSSHLGISYAVFRLKTKTYLFFHARMVS